MPPAPGNAPGAIGRGMIQPPPTAGEPIKAKVPFARMTYKLPPPSLTNEF
jgi:hypothetical protein